MARNSCWRLPARVSKTPCSRMSLVPTSLQSMPRYGLFSFICDVQAVSQSVHPFCQAGSLAGDGRTLKRGCHSFEALTAKILLRQCLTSCASFLLRALLQRQAILPSTARVHPLRAFMQKNAL